MTTRNNITDTCTDGRCFVCEDIAREHESVGDDDIFIGHTGGFPFFLVANLLAAAAIIGILVYAILSV